MGFAARGLDSKALRRDTAAREVIGARDGFAVRLAALTEREREVLSSKSIAKALDISYRTVELHRTHIFEYSGTAFARMMIKNQSFKFRETVLVASRKSEF